jgi:GNAT superfamily N-acetyltransferase
MSTNIHLQPITKSDAELVLKFFQDCTAYFEMEQGKAPDMDTVHNFFDDHPPTHSLEDKLCLAVYQEGEMIATIDILQNYAVAHEWMIGLFLLHPSKRRQGLAQAIHKAIVAKAKAEGAKRLRVGVVTQNKIGQAFWFGLGYQEVKRTPPMRFGNRDNVIIIIQLDV